MNDRHSRTAQEKEQRARKPVKNQKAGQRPKTSNSTLGFCFSPLSYVLSHTHAGTHQSITFQRKLASPTFPIQPEARLEIDCRWLELFQILHSRIKGLLLFILTFNHDQHTPQQETQSNNNSFPFGVDFHLIIKHRDTVIKIKKNLMVMDYFTK